MSRLVRATAILLLALAAGSYVGTHVGAPARGFASAFESTMGSAPAAPAEPRASAPAPAAAPDPASAAAQPGPLPSTADGPALRAWPALNPEATIQRAWMVSEGPHRPGDPHRLVTLTFDDGPFLETTPKVLRLLAQHHVKATFFVVGTYLDGEDKRTRVTRELLRKVHAAGHLIGNHTHDHERLTMRSHTKVLEQIDEGAASIERTIGRRPVLFRPPYGELDAFGEQAARERGLDVVLWNVAVGDMKRDDSHQMFREIVHALDRKEGGLVLLHDIRFTSVAVLRELLPWLSEHRWDPKRPERAGYEVVDLPTYLRAVEASPQPFGTRDELEKSRDERARLRRIRSAGTHGPATVSRR